MGAETSENADFSLLKGEAVSLSNPAFPNAPRILHFLDIQGWMTLVVQEKLQFLVHRLLELVWKRTVIFYEAVRER